jgi:acyl carrier protein
MTTQDSETTHLSSDSIDQNTGRMEPLTAAEIQTWLVSHLAGVLEIDPAEVDVTTPFDRYGLDSVAAIGITGDLEAWLGYDLDPTLLYDYPTIEAVARYLAGEAQG